MDDTLELRQELARAWVSVLDGAIGRGYPSGAVVETMATVAHERFSQLFGPQAAASYLQLLAEQLRQADREETVSLVRGATPEPDPAPESAPLDFGWTTEEPLL